MNRSQWIYTYSLDFYFQISISIPIQTFSNRYNDLTPRGKLNWEDEGRINVNRKSNIPVLAALQVEDVGYNIQFVTFELFPSAKNYRIRGRAMYTNSSLLKIYFVSSSPSSKAVHLVQWSFFQRNHLSKPPFPSRAFFKLSSASASIHFASISTFTPRCVFLAQGCYLSFCPPTSTRSRLQNATVPGRIPLSTGKLEKWLCLPRNFSTIVEYVLV